MSFHSKVCVITGASSGIGRRTALDLAASGATVCLAARREDRLKSVLEKLAGSERGHSYVVTDVSKRSQVKALARHVDSSYGRCDVLINSAGLARPRSFDEPDSVKALEEVMATNFYGTVYCTKAFLPLLLDSAPSHVVNVASAAGRLAFGGGSAYCASKFALVGWSESLAYELAAKNVFVGLVEPGPLVTEGFPQSHLIDHPVLSRALTNTTEVSEAIQEVIEKRKLQRSVPRWFYLLQVPRLVSPPLYRSAQEKILKGRSPTGTPS